MLWYILGLLPVMVTAFSQGMNVRKLMHVYHVWVPQSEDYPSLKNEENPSRKNYFYSAGMCECNITHFLPTPFCIP
jgi:hypothetical protein